jgi:DNA-binding IclR family transcriptional regulator
MTDPDKMRIELSEIAQRGYAVDDEENDAGVRCISAPVFASPGEAVGCIGIDGPSARMTSERLGGLAQQVTATAAALSTHITESTATRADDTAQGDPAVPVPNRDRRHLRIAEPSTGV